MALLNPSSPSGHNIRLSNINETPDLNVSLPRSTALLKGSQEISGGGFGGAHTCTHTLSLRPLPRPWPAACEEPAHSGYAVLPSVKAQW